MLEDFRLRVFVEVARLGSFTKAAQYLHVTQPAVSQNVAELEKGLGVRLFERLKGEVILTSAGEVFMNYAEGILSSYRSVDEMFSRLPDSTVKVYASEEVYAFLVAPAIESFAKVHPEIFFERTIFDDADLSLSIIPSSSFEQEPESALFKVRTSLSLSCDKKIMDSHPAIHENHFYILYKPSPSFASTRTCRLFKDYFASLL